MALTFVVPALLWPRQVMRDVLYDADLPALQTLLGKGRMSAAQPSVNSTDAWWSQYFGIAAGQLAAAPLRLVTTGIKPGTARWLCADPVHLRLDRRGASLTDPALLNISPAEARQLHEALAPLFTNIGELVLATPSHWHLRVETETSALHDVPPRLEDYIEQSAAALLPSGDAARPLRQLLNEVQMALHAHPVNEQRAAQGKTVINSIALWGGGVAPLLQPKTGHRLFTDDRVVAGAGKLAGMEVAPLPVHFTPGVEDCLVYWDALKFSLATHDALTWRERLQEFDDGWLAPALAALAERGVSAVELHGFGDEQGFAVSLSPRDRLAFWRKPRRLESL